jgi:hypothetical protein
MNNKQIKRENRNSKSNKKLLQVPIKFKVLNFPYSLCWNFIIFEKFDGTCNNKDKE